MATIQVGLYCDNYAASLASGYTLIQADGAASADVSIDTIEIYPSANISGLKVGGFADDGSLYYTQTTGHSATGLSAAAGSCVELNAPGDFSAFTISEGEYIGCYFSSGNIERGGTGATVGVADDIGDNFGGGSVLYRLAYTEDPMSLRASGESIGGGTSAVPVFMKHYRARRN